MDETVRAALRRGHLIQITTSGRRSGRPRRVPVVFHAIDGRIFISGRPGFPRSWVANLRANPSFTFHLRGPVVADLPATARVITDRRERERVLAPIAAGWRINAAVMVDSAPLVEVTFDDGA